ncbi:unnamed protein product [Bursaphelenchus okinawaensis]|uniref:TTI1 C-terminal TPR domain-containing protein n=1 Tax=Bursaphelenchus okinawaensis TaxID=465554 RepID=A0A811LJ55_9BILA|nr:unnamed protein product [Bursaphelenchus okinawaensis]CAG9124193.1 unnamed protein product [Bursaphelenchus okinawaensis]
MVLLDEAVQQRVFSFLTRVIPLLDENHEKPTLHDFFPHFHNCLEDCLDNDQLKHELYAEKNVVLFGRIVNTLLNLFLNDGIDKMIRENSGRILVKLFELYNLQSDTLSAALFLPGVISKSLLVIKKSPENQFSLISLKVIHNISLLVLNDSQYEKFENNLKSNEDKENRLKVVRNPQFFRKNGQKLAESVKLISTYMSKTLNERNREELLDLLLDLNKSCSKCLEDTSFEETKFRTMLFSMDLEWPGIQTKCEKLKAQFLAKNHEDLYKLLKAFINTSVDGIVKENANSEDLFTVLVNTMTMLNKADCAKLFAKERDRKSNLMWKLRKCLINNVKIDTNKVELSQTSTTFGNFEGIRFVGCVDNKKLKKIAQVLVTNAFFKKFLRSMTRFQAGKTYENDQKLAAAIVMSYLLKAANEQKLNCDQNLEELFVKNGLKYIEELDKMDNINVIVGNEKPLDLQSQNTKESIYCCTLLTVLGSSTALMNSKTSRFHKFAVDLLYCLLNFLSSTNLMIAKVAHTSLNTLAEKQNMTIDEFISENVDKVVFKVAQQCENLKKYPNSPFVLAELLDRGYGKDKFEQLRLIMPSLLQGIDQNDNLKLIPCLKAMKSFLKCVHQWFGEPKIDKDEQNELQNEVKSLEIDSDEEEISDEDKYEGEECWKRLEKIKEKFEKQRRIQANFQPTVNEEEDVEPPWPVECAYRVIQKTQHLHHCEYAYPKLILMQILQIGFRIMRNCQDQLLPMIHQNYVPMSISMRRKLKERKIETSGENYIILAAELSTLSVMCETSGRFMHMKIRNDIEDELAGFMKRTAEKSRKTCCIYEQSALFKLQKMAFECWPLYCTYAEMDSSKLEETAKLYIDDLKQHQKLREYAENSLKTVKE